MTQSTLNCKNCTTPLEYEDGVSSVKCGACGTTTIVAQAQDDMQSRIADINTQSAAAVHINLTLEKTDWNELALDPSAVTLEELDALMNKIKRLAADKPETYEMCFNYVYACVTKKLDAIAKMLPALVDDYIKNKNFHSAQNTFDSLKHSYEGLSNVSDKTLGELDEYYKQAEGLGLDKARLKDMKGKLESVKQTLGKVSIPNSFGDIPQIKMELERVRVKQTEEYASKGIDAPGLYKEGIAAFGAGDSEAALEKFAQIKNYSDSVKYIEKINLSLTLNNKRVSKDEHFYLAGDRILYDRKGSLCVRNSGLISNSGLPDINKANIFKVYGKLACTIAGNKLGLTDLSKVKIKIVNTKTPQRKGAQELVHEWKAETEFYGNLVVPEEPDDESDYNRDFATSQDFLIAAKTPDVGNKDKSNKEVIKKRNEFLKKHAAGTEPEYLYRNDCYDLWKYDIPSGKLTLLLQNIFDLNRKAGDIFYVKPFADESVAVKKNIAPKYNYKLCCFEENGTVREKIVEGRTTLRDNLEDGSVIFTRKVAVSGNYSDTNIDIVIKKSLEAGAEEFLAAQNVYQYCGCYQNKILYMVGNDQSRNLYSYDIKTAQVTELAKYINQIEFVLENWLYLKIGFSKDFYALVRMPITGGKKEIVVPAMRGRYPVSDWHELSDDQKKAGTRSIKNGRIYYLDYYYSLCSVRLNGTGRMELVREFNDVLCVSRDRLYYIAKDNSPKGKVDSIYSINFDGSMSQKHHFEIQDAKACFSEKIYFTQTTADRSINDLYAEVTEPKIKKALQKVLKAYSKKNVQKEVTLTALCAFDCNSQQTAEVSVDWQYPSLTYLKEIGAGPAVKAYAAKVK